MKVSSWGLICGIVVGLMGVQSWSDQKAVDIPFIISTANAAQSVDVGQVGGTNGGGGPERPERPTSPSDAFANVGTASLLALIVVVVLNAIDVLFGTKFIAGTRKRWYLAIFLTFTLSATGAVYFQTPQEIAERRAAREAREAERASGDLDQSESPQGNAGGAGDEQCWQDRDCWAKRHAADAQEHCKEEIEKLSRFEDVQWTNGWFSSIFSTAWFASYQHPADRENPTIMYVGDDVRFSNGNGAYVRQTYWCSYSPATDHGGPYAFVKIEVGALP